MLAILALTVSIHPVEAATSTNDLEHDVLGMINVARGDHGLKPLRVGNRIWSIAGTRAGRMAASNVLSHTVAGSLKSQIGSKGVPWYAYGEDIGYTTMAKGQAAIQHLFKMWKASPEHWRLMMSSTYNYIGIGLAYRSSNHRTYGSLVFTESPDLTDARVAMDWVGHDGGAATWSWHGWDPILQTHLAGLKSYDVQTRVDSGTWHTVAYRSTSTSRAWTGLANGHSYWMRVRARDKAGNVGPWSEMRLQLS
jgi:hypothetical protein